MNDVLLAIHSFLRWAIILLLLVNIIRLLGGRRNLALSKWLMISAHTTLVIGLYQYYFSPNVGLKGLLERMGSFSAIMKDSFARYWAVEHISGMILAIVLITIGHISLKKGGTARKTAIFYIIALIVILAMAPWPFRALIGRPWI